jgi:hypothetical protein
MKKFSIKSKIITSGLSILTVAVLLLGIGLHEDIYKLIFERQLAGRSSYLEQQIYLDQNLLSSGSTQTIDLVQLLSSNTASELNQEILALLTSENSQSKPEQISIKLLSEKLVDLEEQQKFINEAANLTYTGFESKSKKFFSTDQFGA